MVENIFAVIVLYKKDLEDSETFRSLRFFLENSQYSLTLLVYDNSPLPRKISNHYRYLDLLYVHDSKNGGVSAAYNFAYSESKKFPHKKWLLFLDQDTRFPENFLDGYRRSFELYPWVHMFAPVLKLSSGLIFSPCRYQFKRGFPLKRLKLGIQSLKNVSPVNSGLLVSVQAFEKCGGYNNKVKLDFSDFQFVERFRVLYDKFVVCNIIGYQNFSNNETNVAELNIRYCFFCRGARNCDRSNILDSFQYFLVAFMRAVTLSYRTKKLVFFKTFYTCYLRR